MLNVKRAVGIGAAGLMMLGVVGGIAPAHANHVITPVCNSLASQILTANTDVTNKQVIANNANLNVANRLADLNNAQLALTSALVQFVQANEAGSGVAAAQAILDSVTQNYVNQALAYINAAAARDGAENNVAFAQQTHTILVGMRNALCGDD